MEQTAAGSKKPAKRQGCWLERAPDAWWGQLLLHLPASSRLALFSSSKQLAGVIVQNVRRIKLCFAPGERGGLEDWYGSEGRDRQKSAAVARRRRVIEAILDGCHNLEVVFDIDELQPLPLGLSSRITALHEERKKDWLSERRFTLFGTYQLHSMPQLRVLSVGQGRAWDWADDVGKLCDALETGQLPQLQHFEFLPRVCSSGVTDKERTALQRMAVAAGKQIIHLTTSHTQLLSELASFTKLTSIAVYSIHVSLHHLTLMCDHPGLRTVTFGSRARSYNRLSIIDDASQLSCKWEAIIFDEVHFAEVAKLPLKCVQEVKFLAKILSCHFQEDTTGLIKLLSTQDLKIVCLPDPTVNPGVFKVGSCSEPHSQLVQKIEGAHTLQFGSICDKDSPLSDVWAAVPQCIRHIICLLWRFTGWDTFWQGFPQHVTSLTVSGLSSDSDERGMLQVIAKTPAHVRKITVHLQGEVENGAL